MTANKNKIDNSQPDQFLLEAEWVKSIRTGDSGAFEKLFNTYCQRLINFSRRYVWDKQTAENIVQDIFLKIWQNRTNLDPSKMIKSYLFTAVKNKSIKHLRHADVRKREIETISDFLDANDNPEKELDEKEIALKVHQAINELPEKCREIFSMSRFDKLKYIEIANILDISVKTVETQMGRALKKLRERLKTFITIIIITAFSILIMILGR